MKEITYIYNLLFYVIYQKLRKKKVEDIRNVKYSVIFKISMIELFVFMGLLNFFYIMGKNRFIVFFEGGEYLFLALAYFIVAFNYFYFIHKDFYVNLLEKSYFEKESLFKYRKIIYRAFIFGGFLFLYASILSLVIW